MEVFFFQKGRLGGMGCIHAAGRTTFLHYLPQKKIPAYNKFKKKQAKREVFKMQNVWTKVSAFHYSLRELKNKRRAPHQVTWRYARFSIIKINTSIMLISIDDVLLRDTPNTLQNSLLNVTARWHHQRLQGNSSACWDICAIAIPYRIRSRTECVRAVRLATNPSHK